MSIRHLKKKERRNAGSYYFSFFALSNLLTQTCLRFPGIGQLTSSDHANCKMYIYYLLLKLFASLCHILYFDTAKFSIKLFSLIYTILPEVLGHPLLMKHLTTLVISMSTNLNFLAYNDILGNCVLLIL